MGMMKDLKEVNTLASEVVKEVLATDDKEVIYNLIVKLANDAYIKGTQVDGER
ncbi:hypothetical protein [Aneurinibacillus terranovensis]|uniref:hypothetical protein n=1 Tax=Aneurinibacillus terranovensis TaxID=278991 RepID=UPI0004133711|nr:hypothetical protein [Aneurinibacillus terranovensis]